VDDELRKGVEMRGINLVGMEGTYGHDAPATDADWSLANGPEITRHFPLLSDALIDYYRGKGIRLLKLLFSRERLQPLDTRGPIPAPVTGCLEYFAQIRKIVDHATQQDMRVILQPWQLNGDPANPGPGVFWRGRLIEAPEDVDAFAEFWGTLAGHFKSDSRVEYSLIAEPNGMSTMGWWRMAQKCVDAIRGAGATTTIYVPGNGFTAASSWTDDFYDTAEPRRSNAFGWLNAGGPGIPLHDPLKRTVAEVHVYLDEDESGGSDAIAHQPSELLVPALEEATAQGYRMFVGEIGLYAGGKNAESATTAWTDFLDLLDRVGDVCTGFAWWAGGTPDDGWWTDEHGPHFSVSPSRRGHTAYEGDTVNMTLIEKSFA